MTNMINISLTVSSMYGKISKVEIDFRLWFITVFTLKLNVNSSYANDDSLIRVRLNDNKVVMQLQQQ